MHTIEIDSDVFEFLKNNAEPFVDSPNDVLRRLLLGDTKGVNRKLKKGVSFVQESLPLLDPRMPKALKQILEVSYLVYFRKLSRPEATKRVAEKHGIALQTVQDKYCRQFSTNSSDFDGLLKEAGLVTLRSLLSQRFPDYREEIEDYLSEQ